MSLIIHKCIPRNTTLTSPNCKCEQIERTNVIKYLGIQIDNNLSFKKKHISYVSARLRKPLYILKTPTIRPSWRSSLGMHFTMPSYLDILRGCLGRSNQKLHQHKKKLRRCSESHAQQILSISYRLSIRRSESSSSSNLCSTLITLQIMMPY